MRNSNIEILSKEKKKSLALFKYTNNFFKIIEAYDPDDEMTLKWMELNDDARIEIIDKTTEFFRNSVLNDGKS